MSVLSSSNLISHHSPHSSLSVRSHATLLKHKRNTSYTRPTPAKEALGRVIRSGLRAFSNGSRLKRTQSKVAQAPQRPTAFNTTEASRRTKSTRLMQPIRRKVGTEPKERHQEILQKLRSPGNPQRKSSEEYYKDHLTATFNALKTAKSLPEVPRAQLQAKKVKLPTSSKPKTVVFDLDETLVHCTDDGQPADVYLPIELPSTERVLAGIRVRPYALACLTELKKHFQVVVFTASQQCYADAVLNFLDPLKQLIDYRLYRDNCVCIGGVYLKDLRILSNRSLDQVVIVDNLVTSFAKQLNNGVPIVSWYDDPNDRELLNLSSYLKSLAGVPDVRVPINAQFKLDTFYEDYLVYLKSQNLNP